MRKFKRKIMIKMLRKLLKKPKNRKRVKRIYMGEW